jgi:hypothetical protein
VLQAPAAGDGVAVALPAARGRLLQAVDAARSAPVGGELAAEQIIEDV